MTRARVSVIIPARNEQRLIAGTLESVLCSARSLNTDEVEVIVVDNGSSDRTWKIVQQFVPTEHVIAIQHDLPGAARARNCGRRVATGQILVFLDADTRMEHDCLRRIVHHVEVSGMEGGIVRLAGFEGGLQERLWWSFWEHVRRLPIPRAKAMPALMFCTAAAFDRYGPFDEEVAIGEEWPITAGLYRQYPERFLYDRSITAYSSSRRMQSLPFGYLRTFVKYVWAILHKSGRIHYSDGIR